MDHSYHIRRLMIALYLCRLLYFTSEAFVQVGFERLVAPRPGEGCKHAPCSPRTATKMVAVKDRNKEGAAVVERAPGVRRYEDLKVGDRLKGIVVTELDGKTGKKAWVRVGVTRAAKGGRTVDVNGMIRVDKQKGIKPARMAVDKPVTVYVSKVSASSRRFEVSLRPPKPRKPVVDTSNLRPLSDLTIGEELQGVVKTVTNFAAFVSCGVGRPTRRLRPDGKPAVMEEVDGFLGKDDVPEGEGVALSSQLVKKAGTEVIIREGDVLKVFVKAVHPSNGRFRLTLDPDITPEKANRMKNAAIRTKSRFSMRKQAADLEPGEEILGEIVKVVDYGFFVDVGAKANGLVHISSISEAENRYLGNLRDFAVEGDRMYVRVKGIDAQGRLSLLYVARESDRPKPPNRRERRAAERGQASSDASHLGDHAGVESGTGTPVVEGDGGGFSFDFPPPRGDVGEIEDDDGYTSNLDYDSFDDM